MAQNATIHTYGRFIAKQVFASDINRPVYWFSVSEVDCKSNTQAAGGFGAQFQNNTGAAVTQLDIAYDGEQWYRGNATVGLTFDYSLDATSLMDASATWVTVSALDFAAPNVIDTRTTDDGNLAANREADISSSITGLNIADGGTFFVRWGADGDGKGLSIDNVSVTAIPEPATIGMIGAFGGMMLFIRRRLMM